MDDDHALVPTLNAILPRLAHSLAAYLADARPWISPRQEGFRTALAALVADHRAYADRLAAMILGLGGQPNLGSFPTAYTDLNDMAADFILERLVADTRGDLSTVGRLAERLPVDSPARELVEEIRGNLQGHLDILESLAHADTHPVA
jgi:bacterioferritin (cytochrome b1)